LLPDGRVLVAGGNGSPLASELYNPATGTWTPTNNLNGYGHVATLQPNGLVLVEGNAGNIAELFNPATGTWSNTGSMNLARYNPTATLLPNGKTLVAGGYAGPALFSTNQVEIYDPVKGTWAITGSMSSSRGGHTSTLLPNGRVLVAGGSITNTTELYDPATGTWANTGSLNTARGFHTATLLPDGKVLVAGGIDVNVPYPPISSAELYDPATGIWTNTGSLNIARSKHTATLLPNGKVLVAGGGGSSGLTSSTELYDPATGTWMLTGPLAVALVEHTATLLPNGKVLIAGGGPNTFTFTNAELYNVGLGYSNSWQPQITTVTSPLSLGSNLAITGTGFRGISEGSSGSTQDSPADYPLVQLRSLESGQTVFPPSTNWSATSLNCATVWNFPPGWALATVFVNGIQSTSSIVNITVPVPTPPILTGANTPPDGSFQFGFTNKPGALFGVLATTDLSQPRTNWTALGGVTEIAPGQFQFTDTQVTNYPQRFYSVRVP